ncbi:MAG: DUF1285 domain-containing protein [Deltaproteobacteria bacterium]|nr:DUF1285 domain-containing protein [Deltaproteobacteria bacterium]
MYTAYLKGSLKLSKTGEWWHNGQPFENKRVSDLFTRSVVWDPALKEYFVQIGAQRASFDCEDTAFFVTSIDENTSPWTISISDGSSEQLQAQTIEAGAEDQLYCLVHGTHRARLTRAAHQSLLQHVSTDNSLNIEGRLYIIKRAEDGIQDS